MEITNNPEAARLVIQGFLIGLQCTLMLIFIIITIIDLKNTRKEWKSTESWINQVDTQLKFEAQIFCGQDDQTENVKPLEKHPSRVIIEDPAALVLEKMFNKYGEFLNNIGFGVVDIEGGQYVLQFPTITKDEELSMGYIHCLF